MPYIGRGPSKSGAFRILKDFSSSFNGSTTSFAIQDTNGTALSVATPQNLMIAVDGVMQEPGSAYTISGTNIVFGSAPQADATFWGVELGDIGGTSVSSSDQILVTATGHSFVVGRWMKATSTDGVYAYADCTTEPNAEVAGVIISVTTDTYTLQVHGTVTGDAVPAQASGTIMFLDASNGQMTTTETSTAGRVSNPLAIVTKNDSEMVILTYRGEVISSNVQTNAPNDAQYVTLATNSTLTAERTLAGGTDLTLSDAGAGGAVTINHDDNFSGSAAQYTSATVTVNATGHITAIASGTAGPSQANQAAIEAETNEDTYVPPDLLKHSPGVAKAYCSVARDGTLQSNSYNVTSYARNSTGNYTVTWATDFANTNYSAHVNAEDSSYFARAGVPATGTQAVNIRNTSGVAADSAHNITAFGDQ